MSEKKKEKEKKSQNKNKTRHLGSRHTLINTAKLLKTEHAEPKQK